MNETMRAVAYRKSLPISDPASLEDVELPVPTPGPHDLRLPKTLSTTCEAQFFRNT